MNILMTMNKYTFAALLTTSLLLLFPIINFGSDPDNKTFRIAFYNVENLFDTEHDDGKFDEEFLPDGDRYWNNRKLNLKLNRIYQVIMALGQGNLPAIVGMCEVENLHVVELLLARTRLGRMGYRVVHQESPDRRGIDVAMLYHSKQFSPISYQAIPLSKPGNPDFKTRDILHVTGVMATDTLHFFVNHWPSKYGGVVETESSRALAARTLKLAVDSLFSNEIHSKIIIIGDMNDSPFDDSVNLHLKAQHNFDSILCHQIYNLAYPLASKGIGSNKFQGKWEMIDQIMVSGALLGNEKLTTTPDAFTIFDADFLLEKDKNFLGEKPFRTYMGFKYHNGFSDHLPVYIDLRYRGN